MRGCFLRTMKIVSPNSGTFERTNIRAQNPETRSSSIKLKWKEIYKLQVGSLQWHSEHTFVRSLWLMTLSREGTPTGGHGFFLMCICATEIWGSFDWPVDSLTSLKMYSRLSRLSTIKGCRMRFPQVEPTRIRLASLFISSLSLPMNKLLTYLPMHICAMEI